MRAKNGTTRMSSSLGRLHANQSGAVGFMVLAGILISLMMGLVIYDTTPVARQKMEVQGAADMAAYSQSAVESRSMNMIALANVGKRIAMGQTLFYDSLWKAFRDLIIVAGLAALAACIAAIFTAGIAAKLCEFLVRTVAEIGKMMQEEATDLMSWRNRIQDYVREDVESIDNYQTYFQGLTPWWSWSEQYVRGLRNGALATSGWPVPRNALDELPSVPGLGNLGSGLVDELPIERYDDYDELCTRSLTPDLIAHGLDYVLQIALCSPDCIKEVVGYKGTRAIVFAITGLLAAYKYYEQCDEGTGGVLYNIFGAGNRPFMIKEPGSEAEWLRATSNLVFAYRPGEEMSTDYRQKYGFLSADYTSNLDVVYKADGFLGMARSEISYQHMDDGGPDMWHPSWSARMRPVALPGEWAGYGDTRMVSAFHDAAPYLMATSALGGLIDGIAGGDAIGMGTADPADLLKAEMAFDSMNDEYVDGVAR